MKCILFAETESAILRSDFILPPGSCWRVIRRPCCRNVVLALASCCQSETRAEGAGRQGGGRRYGCFFESSVVARRALGGISRLLCNTTAGAIGGGLRQLIRRHQTWLLLETQGGKGCGRAAAVAGRSSSSRIPTPACRDLREICCDTSEAVMGWARRHSAWHDANSAGWRAL